MTQWFWDSPAWTAYRQAYQAPHPTTNFSTGGNLVISLDQMMWTKVRKGHQAAIRQAERKTLGELRTLVVLADTGAKAFQEIHRLDAGRVTRPQETWDLMEQWLGGHGLLLTAWKPALDLPVAGAYFIVDGPGAYYASAARHPDHHVNGAAHLLVWTAMKMLRDMGCKWLDMGPVPDPADEKAVSISKFKSHFGAVPKVWPDYA